MTTPKRIRCFYRGRGWSCPADAEWEILDAEEKNSSFTCTEHVGRALTEEEHFIFRIDPEAIGLLPADLWEERT